MKNIFIKLNDELATKNFAKNLAKILSANLIIHLQGELGAGKTTLVRHILHRLNYKGRVKSPSYTLVESYQLEKFTVHHFDLYRFNSVDEWHEAGLSELLSEDYICFIEWADKASGVLPTPDLNIQLKFGENATRNINIVALSASGIKCLNQLIVLLDAD